MSIEKTKYSALGRLWRLLKKSSKPSFPLSPGFERLLKKSSNPSQFARIMVLNSRAFSPHPALPPSKPGGRERHGSLGFFILITLIAALLCCPQAKADDDDDERPEHRIPKVGQPAQDFYNASGSGITLRAEASPTHLTTRDWLTLKLTISNLLNAPDVEKPSLKKLADFKDFQIDEAPELDPKFDLRIRDRRIFVYRLRPASKDVKLIPAIPFYYYDPKIRVPAERPQLAFPKRYSNAIAIEVKAPAVDDKPPPIPLDVPEFATILNRDALSKSDSRDLTWLWPVVLVVPPLVAMAWITVWRRLYPDAARLSQIRRIKAVRHALSQLASAKRKRSEDPAAAIANIVVTYLHERFDLPLHARTPQEVALALQSQALGISSEHVEQAAALFRDCDAARFSSAQPAATQLADEAERLIIALEGAK